MRKDISFIPGENPRAKHYNRFTSHGQRKIANADFLEQLSANKLNLAKAYLFCLYSNTTKGSFIISEARSTHFGFGFFHFAFKALSKIQNILFSATGVILSLLILIDVRFSRFTRFIAFAMLGVLLVSAMSCFQCDRFSIIYYPMVVILGSHYLLLSNSILTIRKP